MKKLLVLSLLLGSAIIARATVTLDFSVGILTGADGTTPIADGSLIQLIAAPTTGGFVAPTPTTFTSGSEILLWSGAFDSTTAFPPVSLNGGAMSLAPGPIDIAILPAGYALMVQWFPTLLSTAVAPGYSTPYGQYSTLNDVSWVSPSNGSTVSFTFQTVSWVGSSANSLGAASLTTAAIPEPSTYAAIFGALALGFVAYRRRRQAA
jgi:hypothetical protein